MTIDKINLGKVFKKQDLSETKKQEKQIPTMGDDANDVTLSKLRGAAAAKYLAAMMGVAALGGGLQSCVEATAIAQADQSFLQQLMEAINKMNETNNKILEEIQKNNSQNEILIDLLTKQNKQNDQILKLLADVSSGVLSIEQAINKLAIILEQANTNDEEFLEKMDIIINGQGTEQEKLDDLIRLNEEQNAWLSNIATLIANLSDGDEKLAAILTDFYNAYLNGEKSHSELMDAIYGAILENNSQNDEILAKLEAIMNSNVQDSEKLAQIIELLGNIDNKLGDILDELRGISGKLDDLIDANDKNNDAILNALTNIDADMDQVIENQKENNKNTLKIAQNTDEIIALLGQMNDKLFTLDELKEMLGPLFDKISGELTAELISADELSAILEAYKTDLTKTNSLIENLTAVVKNLNLGAGGVSPEDFQKVVDAINDFKAQESTNDAEQMNAYQDILQAILGLQGGLDAIADRLDDLSSDFSKYASNVKLYGDEVVDLLGQLRTGQEVSIETIEAFAQKANDAAVQAQQARNEQIALLQALVDKETGGNGGITKEELEEVLAGLGVNIPDYTQLLEEISDKIGNVITSDDLQNFFLKTQPDLTKTNALIETLTSVLKNKNFSVTGDVNVNMKEVENLLGLIYDLIASGKAPTQDQVNELIDLVEQIQENTSAEPALAPRRANSFLEENPYFYALVDAANAYRATLAKDAYNA